MTTAPLLRWDAERSPGRRISALAAGVVVVAALWAGVGDGIINGGGWQSFGNFWAAAINPELSTEFLRLTIEAAAVTFSYAVLGTVLSILFGVVAAVGLSELLLPRGLLRPIIRLLLIAPRSIHEVLWALLLIQILGFDPLVPILAIAIPYGAVTGRVFAETIDEANSAPYHLLRSGGARRLSALLYGVLPTVRGELLSYTFYRFECSVRSAAVLGVVGAGGLGFQLDLSFETLRYREIWTLIAALMLLSGLIEGWSSLIRRSLRAEGDRTTASRTSTSGTAGPKTATSRTGLSAGSPAGSDRTLRWSLFAVLAIVPLAWYSVGLNPAELWSDRKRRLAGDLLGDLLPPRLGLGGWSDFIQASVDTVAMSILALAFAAGLALVLGAVATRPVRATASPGRPRRASRQLANIVLLLFRAVPAPIWAFLMVLILFPGPWPGAVALGVYTVGVLGRLFAEAFEDRETRPATAMDLIGASGAKSFFYGTLPMTANRLIALSLYRWEVIARETVVVGVVGAGGLGQLLNEHVAARDFAAVTGALGALVAMSIVIDATSSVVRRQLRTI